MLERFHTLTNRVVRKASASGCTYKVGAIAYDKRGNVVGIANNTHARWNVLSKCSIGRAGTSRHAEARLMARYGKRVRSIVITRVGHSGSILPIDPCETCRHIADKLGIKIYSIVPITK